MQIKERGLLICVLMLNAPCYFMHSCTTRLKAQMAIRWKSPISRVSLMPYIDVNPNEYRGRFATKGVGCLSYWDVSASPQSPITLRYSTSRHQRASAPLIFDSLSFPPIATVKKSVARHAHKTQQMLSH